MRLVSCGLLQEERLSRLFSALTDPLQQAFDRLFSPALYCPISMPTPHKQELSRGNYSLIRSGTRPQTMKTPCLFSENSVWYVFRQNAWLRLLHDRSGDCSKRLTHCSSLLLGATGGGSHSLMENFFLD